MIAALYLRLYVDVIILRFARVEPRRYIS